MLSSCSLNYVHCWLRLTQSYIWVANSAGREQKWQTIMLPHDTYLVGLAVLDCLWGQQVLQVQWDPSYLKHRIHTVTQWKNMLSYKLLQEWPKSGFFPPWGVVTVSGGFHLKCQLNTWESWNAWNPGVALHSIQTWTTRIPLNRTASCYSLISSAVSDKQIEKVAGEQINTLWVCQLVLWRAEAMHSAHCTGCCQRMQ